MTRLATKRSLPFRIASIVTLGLALSVLPPNLHFRHTEAQTGSGLHQVTTDGRNKSGLWWLGGQER